MLNSTCTMREEIPKNEDIITARQTAKVISRLGNSLRRQVSPGWIIFWYLLALLAIAAWAYRLLGWLPELPF